MHASNIALGLDHNFRKTSETIYTTSNTPFDVESVMMYGPTYFGILDSRGERKTVIESRIPGTEIRCDILTFLTFIFGPGILY